MSKVSIFHDSLSLNTTDTGGQGGLSISAKGGGGGYRYDAFDVEITDDDISIYESGSYSYEVLHLKGFKAEPFWMDAIYGYASDSIGGGKYNEHIFTCCRSYPNYNSPSRRLLLAAYGVLSSNLRMYLVHDYEPETEFASKMTFDPETGEMTIRNGSTLGSGYKFKRGKWHVGYFY